MKLHEVIKHNYLDRGSFISCPNRIRHYYIRRNNRAILNKPSCTYLVAEGIRKGSLNERNN